MYLTRIEIEGFRGAEHETIEPKGPLVALPPGLAGAAMRDALDMLAAGLAPTRLADTAARMGFAGPNTKVEGAGDSAELVGLVPPAVGAVLLDGLRSITVDAQFALDPPLYGRLREHAARDPRMVTALGQDPSVRVKVGWLFSKDRTVATPAVLFVRVGEVGFDTSGKDRPAWVPELMADIGRRFLRIPAYEDGAELAERWLSAALSPDPQIRAGVERARATLAAAPFSLPTVEIVRADGGVALAFGEELVRARQLGGRAVDAVRLVLSAYVGRPDVLVLDEPPDVTVKAWLTALPEASDAPVEQVWSP